MATTTRPQTASAGLDNLYEQSVKEQNWRSQDEARLAPPVRINTKKRFLFRFKTGTGPRELTIRVPHLSDVYDDERKERKMHSLFAKSRKKFDGENPKYDLEAVREEVGDSYIKFNTIRGNGQRQGTCWYATDDPGVAAFIRKLIKTDPSLHTLEEQRPNELIEVNGVSIPNTTEGWDAARIAALTKAASIDED
jgi:hypothetical protein